jgi:hypothetical protein
VAQTHVHARIIGLGGSARYLLETELHGVDIVLGLVRISVFSVLTLLYSPTFILESVYQPMEAKPEKFALDIVGSVTIGVCGVATAGEIVTVSNVLRILTEI